MKAARSSNRIKNSGFEVTIGTPNLVGEGKVVTDVCCHDGGGRTTVAAPAAVAVVPPTMQQRNP